jgi:hypothetical protein
MTGLPDVIERPEYHTQGIMDISLPSPANGSRGCVRFEVFEECRLLVYKNPLLTSQESHYVSATELSQLILCKT